MLIESKFVVQCRLLCSKLSVIWRRRQWVFQLETLRRERKSSCRDVLNAIPLKPVANTRPDPIFTAWWVGRRVRRPDSPTRTPTRPKVSWSEESLRILKILTIFFFLDSRYHMEWGYVVRIPRESKEIHPGNKNGVCRTKEAAGTSGSYRLPQGCHQVEKDKERLVDSWWSLVDAANPTVYYHESIIGKFIERIEC